MRLGTEEEEEEEEEAPPLPPDESMEEEVVEEETPTPTARASQLQEVDRNRQPDALEKLITADVKAYQEQAQREKEATPESYTRMYDGGSHSDPPALAAALSRLHQLRHQERRPYEIIFMSLDQANQEKAAVKKELRDYDLAFQAEYKRLPIKSEKEVMRPLYQRYRDVKAHIDRMGDGGEVEVSTSKMFSQPTPRIEPEQPCPPAEQTEQEEYSALRAEKRRLQVHLLTYEKNFQKKNGRKMRTREDRAPIQLDYERYKAIKQRLSELAGSDEQAA
eukprot:GCRY01005524.1.p1 GENE.GCRY01005524.1~~GCRY01005524.1.p1  ORF type:complete len:277 (-),score=97.65 GCRY01005524.1:93-923(-)